MLFNSKIFISFILLTLGIYYWLNDRHKILFLLLMSYVFYGFWDPWLCSLIALSTFVDYWCGRKIYEQPHSKKRWLYLSLCTNLSILGFFKYYDFFVEEFIYTLNIFGMNVVSDDYLLNLILPVGISFYTFQTMAYTIDLYRGDLQKPEMDFWKFALYVSFFPQLVAGPVERAPHLLPQFSRPFRCSVPMIKEGVFLILLGFIKKVVIADRLAQYIEPYFENFATDGAIAACCMLLFTCQIYVDFSSYSDIAIGLGLLLGYSIRSNFNLPFVVPSIPERWRRWHLSMSHWFRDYIFIPLGGSRKGKVRTQINILIVMFLSGLWHGASNNFVIWGLGNGLTMVGHKLLSPYLKRISKFFGTWKVSDVSYYYLCCWNTFCMIATINIFFRCPTFEISQSYVHHIFFNGLEDHIDFFNGTTKIPAAIVDGSGWVFIVFLVHECQRYFDVKSKILSSFQWWMICCCIMFWTIITFGISGPQFIYYQF